MFTPALPGLCPAVSFCTTRHRWMKSRHSTSGWFASASVFLLKFCDFIWGIQETYEIMWDLLNLIMFLTKWLFLQIPGSWHCRFFDSHSFYRVSRPHLPAFVTLWIILSHFVGIAVNPTDSSTYRNFAELHNNARIFAWTKFAIPDDVQLRTKT